MFYLYANMCTMCLPDNLKGQKRALDVLELELQTISSFRVIAGYPCPLEEQWVLLTAESSFYLLGCLSAHLYTSLHSIKILLDLILTERGHETELYLCLSTGYLKSDTRLMLDFKIRLYFFPFPDDVFQRWVARPPCSSDQTGRHEQSGKTKIKKVYMPQT